MNKRIKELAEQAGFKVNWQHEDVQAIKMARFEKFAELIVKECCVALNPMLRDMISRGQAYDLIKQHFRVEDNSIKVGSRIKVISGFNVGAKGTVSYIEPTGKLWVRRDGASSDVFYHPEELIGVEE